MNPINSRNKRLTRNKRSRARRIAEGIFKIFGFLETLCYPANNFFVVERYVLANEAAPEPFQGFTIVQLSDLHGKEFGHDNSKLLEAVVHEKPGIILVTGDLVDERHFEPEKAAAFVQKLAKIAPTYYIVGNHEADFFDEFREPFLDALRLAGAVVLNDESVTLRRGDAKIILAGVRDPAFFEPYDKLLDEKLKKISDDADDDSFKILMSHRPNGFDAYVKYGFNLVFAGHAHGGQFRFPGLLPNGLNAPGQGWFPRYTCGARQKEKTTMVVSRGLGPSVIPTRLFNRPELVVCQLKTMSNEKKS